MRIACETCRCLAGNQQFGELGMSFVEFNVVCCNFGENISGLLRAVMFVGQADENFIIPWFRNESVLPARFPKIVQRFWRLVLFNLFGIPGADKEDEVVGNPVRAS